MATRATVLPSTSAPRSRGKERLRGQGEGTMKRRKKKEPKKRRNRNFFDSCPPESFHPVVGLVHLLPRVSRKQWNHRGEASTKGNEGRKKKGTAPETFWPTISKLNLIFLGALDGELAGSDSSSHPRTASHHDVLVKYSNGCRVPLIYPALGPSQTTSLISMFRSKADRAPFSNAFSPCWISYRARSFPLFVFRS